MTRPTLTWLLALCAASSVAGATATVRSAPARRFAAASSALETGHPDAALAALGPARSEDPPPVRYLRGTALLGVGKSGEAVAELTGAVAATGDPELGWRALHNLALAHLDLASRSAGAGRALNARAAVAASRHALRLRPGDPGTSWNLALALRLVPSPNEGGGRGDRGGRPVMPGMGGASGERVPSPGRDLSPDEARALLDALRSAEAPSLLDDAVRRLRGRWMPPRSGGPPW